MNLENYFDIKDLLAKIATDEGRLSASISVEAIERQVFVDADVLGVGAGGDLQDVAGSSRIDRPLNGYGWI